MFLLSEIEVSNIEELLYITKQPLYVYSPVDIIWWYLSEEFLEKY